MIKKVLSTLLILSIIAICPITAFASVATPSDAERNVSGVYEDFMDDFQESDDFDMLDAPMLMSSSADPDALPNILNTVDLSRVYMNMRYLTMNGSVNNTGAYFNDSGYASVSRPSTFASFSSISIQLESALPSSGTYNFSARFSSNTGVTYTRARLYTERTFENAMTEASWQDISLSQLSGDWYVSAVVDLGKVSKFSIFLYSNDLVPPYGGYLKVYFGRTNATPTHVTAGGSYSSTDKIADSVQDVSNNTAALVEKQDSIIDQIVDTTQTISNQLHAFWDQLAGEFTNLYNKMNQQHAEQLEADRDNTEDIIAAEQANTTDIINNNNQNTERVVNGYDASRLDSSNSLLGENIREMESAEKDLMNDVSNNINDFQYTDYFARIRGPLSDISYFLNGMYNGIKGLNIPIGFSLTLTIAMLCIGYYRFKGGT